MVRVMLAVGMLIMSGHAQAMTVLDTRLVTVLPHRDLVARPAIGPVTSRDDHQGAAASVYVPRTNAAGAAVPSHGSANTAFPPTNAGAGLSAVPDVVIWGLMICGVGYVGLAASRRRPAVAA